MQTSVQQIQVCSYFVVPGLFGLVDGGGYLLWGLYYAVLHIGEQYLWGDLLKRLPKVVQHGYALFLILLGWLIFRSTDLHQIQTFLSILFGAAGTGGWDHQTTYYLLEFRWEFLFGILAALPLKKYVIRLAEKDSHPKAGTFLLTWGKPALALTLGGLSVLSLVSTSPRRIWRTSAATRTTTASGFWILTTTAISSIWSTATSTGDATREITAYRSCGLTPPRTVTKSWRS